MSNKPFISVVIPLYNKQNYIHETIVSVLEQKYNNFELIIVDDGSTDNSAKIVKGFLDSRLKYVYKKNQGVSAARNKGIELAKYDLIAFLDADDLWESNYLETIIELYIDYPEASFYGTSYFFKLGENGSLKTPVTSLKKPKKCSGLIDNYFQASLLDPFHPTSGIVIRKEVFEKVGYFLVGQKLAEDLDMWTRIALKYKMAFSMKQCVQYRYEIEENAKNRVTIDEDLIVIVNLEKYLLSMDLRCQNNKYIKQYISLYSIKCATKYYLVNDISNANRLINRAIIHAFYSMKLKFLVKACLKKLTFLRTEKKQ